MRQVIIVEAVHVHVAIIIQVIVGHGIAQTTLFGSRLPWSRNRDTSHYLFRLQGESDHRCLAKSVRASAASVY